MQSRFSIITPRDVILNQGESEDTSMEVVIQVQNLNQAEQEKTSPEQDDMSQDQSPNVSVYAPRLDLIPEFNLTTQEQPITEQLKVHEQIRSNPIPEPSELPQNPESTESFGETFQEKCTIQVREKISYLLVCDLLTFSTIL